MKSVFASLIAGLFAVLLFAGATFAQEVPASESGTFDGVEAPSLVIVRGVELPADAPDYEEWARVASRAERVLEVDRASELTLENLRAQIVTWRSQFDTAREKNSVRIETLETQIDALGVPPEDEAVRDAAADEREILSVELNKLALPVRAAEVAYARADTIVDQIDEVLRSRQTDALLDLWPTPANPANWAAGFNEIGSTFTRAMGETQDALAVEENRTNLRGSLMFLLILIVSATVLLARGRRWIAAAGEKVRKVSDGPTRGVWAFLISLGQIAVPLLGLMIALVAVNATGVIGDRGSALVNAIAGVVSALLVARWIGLRVFGGPGIDWQVLDVDDRTRTEGRFEATLLGVAYGLSQAVAGLASSQGYSETAQSVLHFPVILFMGILLARLGRLISANSGVDEAEEGEGPGFIARTLSLLGRAVLAVGILGPIAALIGQVPLALHVMNATALTLGLIAVLLALHGFFIDLYGAVARKNREEASEALVPVLGSLVILILAGPVVALIWGARENDLLEIWNTVKQGVSIGETTITPGDVLSLIVVFFIGFGLTRLLQGMLKTTVLPKTKMDIGGRNAITAGIGYLGYFLAAVIAVTSVGINLSSLAVVAGALSVGIGFGLQNIVSNFVSGIILLIERPISEGDWISVGTDMGIVKDISVRSTRIETFDKQDVVIPNSDLISGVVTNYTRGNKVGRLVIDVGVAYGTDTRRVKEILLEIVHNHPIVSVNPEPQVGFMNFGADSLDFQIRAVLSDVGMILVVRDELNHQIAERFAEEGIEIPFAQRDIWLRNPEALRAPKDVDGQAITAKPEPDDPTLDPDGDPEDGNGDGD